jgi:pilus assembly protein CpaF
MNNPTSHPTAQVVDPDKLKTYLKTYISNTLESRQIPPEQRYQVVSDLLAQAYQSTKLNLSSSLRDTVFKVVLDELIGFGPIQQLLDDPEVTEVMVNGAKEVYIEKNGRLMKSTVVFENDDEVLRLIDRIILPLGRRIDPDSPMVDARLPDGSRVNAIIPPVAIDGPSITIRKFLKEKLSIQQLIDGGSLTKNMAEFLRACVVSKLNILISGGTGSGKTTLLNALSGFIPSNERIITIEDAAELKLQQPHIVRCETKVSDTEGRNSVSIRDLVKNSLRMRPDRIVVGEVRGPEALDMLQAMNTGHDGSLTTLHSNSPRDATSRLETMCLMAGIDFPLKVIREQIASAIDLIIQQSRLKDGRRKIVSITEVNGMEGDKIVMTEIFTFAQSGTDKDGLVTGELKPTGIRPMFSDRLQVAGYNLGSEIFGGNIMDNSRRK